MDWRARGLSPERAPELGAQHPGFRAIAVAAPPPERLRNAPPRLELALGNIAAEAVDAIVHAANQSLLAGTDDAVHAAAGPELLEACVALGGCAIGDAKATPGFRLPAPWVIHAVAPPWQGGTAGEAKLLASAYKRVLAVADELGARSVAIPPLGVYEGFPLDDATELAVDTVLATRTRVDLVRFVCRDRRTLEAYDRILW